MAGRCATSPGAAAPGAPSATTGEAAPDPHAAPPTQRWDLVPEDAEDAEADGLEGLAGLFDLDPAELAESSDLDSEIETETEALKAPLLKDAGVKMRSNSRSWVEVARFEGADCSAQRESHVRDLGAACGGSYKKALLRDFSDACLKPCAMLCEFCEAYYQDLVQVFVVILRILGGQ